MLKVIDYLTQAAVYFPRKILTKGIETISGYRSGSWPIIMQLIGIYTKQLPAQIYRGNACVTDKAVVNAALANFVLH